MGNQTMIFSKKSCQIRQVINKMILWRYMIAYTQKEPALITWYWLVRNSQETKKKKHKEKLYVKDDRIGKKSKWRQWISFEWRNCINMQWFSLWEEIIDVCSRVCGKKSNWIISHAEKYIHFLPLYLQSETGARNFVLVYGSM